MKNFLIILLLSPLGFLWAQKPVHKDKPFEQEYSVKYYFGKETIPLGVQADRNQTIRVVTKEALLIPQNGAFLQHGNFVQDQRHRTAAHKPVVGITSVNQQFVFTDQNTIYSQAWAGKLLIPTPFPNAHLIAGSDDFHFLISDGKNVALVNEQKTLLKHLSSYPVLKLIYHVQKQSFFFITDKELYVVNKKGEIKTLFKGQNLSSFDLDTSGKTVYIGTSKGYIAYDLVTAKNTLFTKVPVSNITAVAYIDNKLWLGTPLGAFTVKEGKINYYNGERWMPSNEVVSIEKGPNQSVLILTKAGLAQMFFHSWTLAQKAAFYDKQVRSRHIRHGFNASLSGMEPGNIHTGYLADSDNDGLWTSMYLAAEAFRYAVTKSPEALQNTRESLDAMERLFTINPVPGFPARSFERKGYIEKLADPERWQPAQDENWDWKSTTSSDEAIGHMFVYGVIAEVVDDPSLKKQAIRLMDTLMSHIVKNDLYLIDFDGKPTLWGKWNPEYVNGFPTNVGDRKLNSSNIISMLQTAYHFTKKEKYKAKALELLNKHGYFENLMRPMAEIGKVEEGDDYAKMLSESWNHSDDEMYFLGYWGLYRYALNDTLKAAYKKSILDHFEAERPEKEGLWNIFTSLTGTPNFDLENAIWYLQEFPMDLIQWDIANSHREDIEKLPTNFRKQYTKEVLPPDERAIQRHNGNMFNMDRKGSLGKSEHSAGDIWLLPYWLGKFLKVID